VAGGDPGPSPESQILLQVLHNYGSKNKTIGIKISSDKFWSLKIFKELLRHSQASNVSIN
jgi:hypothetical protein